MKEERLLISREIRLDGGRILETSEGRAATSLWEPAPGGEELKCDGRGAGGQVG